MPRVFTNCMTSKSRPLASTSFPLSSEKHGIGVLRRFVRFGPRLYAPDDTPRTGRHDLQLAGAFIDGGDAGVAQVAFDGIVLHVARAAENLDGVVGHFARTFRRSSICTSA